MDCDKLSHVTTTKVPYKTIPLLQKFLLLSRHSQSPLPNTSTLGNRGSVFHSYSFFLGFHINGIMKYVATHFWLLSLSRMHLRLIHVLV